MNKIKSVLAVLVATVAVATSFQIKAAPGDPYYGNPALKGLSVEVQPSTGIQISPPSLLSVQGWNTNYFLPVSGGTNYIVGPFAQFISINATNAVNLIATNAIAGTSWETRVFINANNVDRLFTYPSYWFWSTNSATGIKPVAISSNGISLFSIRTFGTNVYVSGGTFRP